MLVAGRQKELTPFDGIASPMMDCVSWHIFVAPSSILLAFGPNSLYLT